MPYIVGVPEATPVRRTDAEGRLYFFFRLREYRYGRWKSKNCYPVYAYVPITVSDLVAPGHMVEVEGDYVEVAVSKAGATRKVFKAEAASPREWKVEEDLPDTRDLSAG